MSSSVRRMKTMHPGDKTIFNNLLRIALFRVVLPYLRHLIDQIRNASDPTEALERLLRNRLPASAVAALLGGTLGIGVGAQVAVASMGFWSGLGYSLGLVSVPLWGPVAGGILGAAAVGGVAYATLSGLHSQATQKIATGPSSLAVTTAATALVSPEVWEGTENLLDALLSVDFGASAQQRRKDILARGVDVAAAAASIAATVSGRVELLAVVAEGYALARAALANSREGKSDARRRAQSLASELGVDPKALALLMSAVDEHLDRVEQRKIA